MEPLFYKLTEAEALLRVSRNTLLRFERVSMLVFQGENHGKRVTGASLRALARRIEAGEDLWETLKDLESAAPSEAPPTAKARSTRTKQASGGTSPQPKTAGDSPASEPLVSKGPSWLKKSI